MSSPNDRHRSGFPVKTRHVWTLTLLVFLSLSSPGQSTDQYLVAIPLDERCDRGKLEALQPHIYYNFGTTLIAGVSPEKIGEMQRSNISYSIIDDAAWSQQYYLISPRKGTPPGALPVSAGVLFKDGGSFLVKALSADELNLDQTAYRCVELRKIPRPFLNERIIPTYLRHIPVDSTIERLVAQIDPDSVHFIIEGLQNFGTRFMLTPNRDTVAEWLRIRFLSLGFTDVVIDSFDCRTNWNGTILTVQKNVIATLHGTSDPERVFIVGGHADSYSGGNPYATAPGADDNASGTAAVLEMARVIMKEGYKPKSTIKFVTFGAEELMLYGDGGCWHFAADAQQKGMNIELMINHDMISHDTSRMAGGSVDINYYSGYEHLLNFAQQATQRFSHVTPLAGTRDQASDSYPFWAQGFPAIYFEEHQFSPYYHTPQDIVSNYNMQYCAEVIKASCAMLLRSSTAPSSVRDFTITDAGDGSSLMLRWSRCITRDVKGYSVHVGKASSQYDTTLFVTDSMFVVRNLIEGVRYFVGVAAMDSEGNESFILERSGIPYSKPLPPANLAADPTWHKVLLHWNPNMEGDLLGYYVYRSDSQAGAPSNLTPSPVRDTSFTHVPAHSEPYAYYTVRAVDSTFQESISSAVVRSRPVSLAQGLLLVDETKPGDGSLMLPTDAQIDTFYHRTLGNFSFEEFDVETQGPPVLADLGAYSTVFWHGNDLSDFSAALSSRQELAKYLEFGGKLLLSSYRPTSAFGNYSAQARDFAAGEFVYDYLKIKHAENRVGALFSGATAVLNGYPAITVDTSKTWSSTGNHLFSIEGISAAPGAAEIYRYDSRYDTTRIEGKMKGQPVGIEYLGSDFKMIVVSFPLYYMDFDAATELVRFALSNRLSEPMAVKEQGTSVPKSFEVLQNYPNPFNPVTAIRFSIPAHTFVTLKIFDILGKEVVSLISEDLPPGEYTTTWEASAQASGVYFYRMTAGPFARTRKLMVIR